MLYCKTLNELYIKHNDGSSSYDLKFRTVILDYVAEMGFTPIGDSLETDSINRLKNQMRSDIETELYLPLLQIVNSQNCELIVDLNLTDRVILICQKI